VPATVSSSWLFLEICLGSIWISSLAYDFYFEHLFVFMSFIKCTSKFMFTHTIFALKLQLQTWRLFLLIATFCSSTRWLRIVRLLHFHLCMSIVLFTCYCWSSFINLGCWLPWASLRAQKLVLNDLLEKSICFETWKMRFALKHGKFDLLTR